VPKDTNAERGTGAHFKETTLSQRAQRVRGTRPTLAGNKELSYLIESIIAAGAYLSLSSAGNGDALLIRILHDDRKIETYCRTDEELLAALFALARRYPYSNGNGTPDAP